MDNPLRSMEPSSRRVSAGKPGREAVIGSDDLEYPQRQRRTTLQRTDRVTRWLDSCAKFSNQNEILMTARNEHATRRITLESQPLQVRIALPHDPAPSDLLPNVEPLDKDDTRATAAPPITLESQTAHLREPQPHSKTVALPHDPAPSDFFSNVESLDMDDAGALAALSVSLAATTLGDAPPGPLHAWRNHHDPAPSSEDEGIEMGKTLPHEKTCVVENSLSFPPPRKYTGVGAPHSSEEGRTDTTDEPIAPAPPLRRRRRSRAERAARSAAWARSVFESTSSAKHQIERARDTHTVAPKFRTPNVFAQRPTCIMVFVEREPLFEFAENYYEAECTDTEDALIGFVRENRTRRRVRNRVALHRGRRAAAVRRERMMAQERAEESDATIAQAVVPALQQPAGPVQLVAPIPVQQQHAPVQRPEELPPALEPAAPEAVDEIVRELAAAAREDARMEVDQVADPNPFEGLLHFAPRDPRAAAPEPAFALFEAQGEDQDDVMPLLRLVAELPPLEGAPAPYPAGHAAPPHDLVHNGAQDADARGPGYYRAELLPEVNDSRPSLRMRIQRINLARPGGTLCGLENAVRIASRMICDVCGFYGSNISCGERECKSTTHYGCAVSSGWSLDENCQTAWCGVHKRLPDLHHPLERLIPRISSSCIPLHVDGYRDV
ncbi:hypothetical protein QAD02_012980 [Eretmocerus hayati]|uniref:Uncharacterized protein n=1 Tax=Eretmocerus hayati TaxID=131215 RepID=A0ACC2P268_9HYME|nr:hypothetical protein QAD02_012980 [Eretmocerus hayati]